MLTSTRKGAIAEAAIAAEAVKLGCDVYRPLAEGGRYDLIIDNGHRLLRTQCKWARLRGQVIVVGIRTSRLTPSGYVRTTYSAGEIGGIAAYCASIDQCFWLPIEEFAGQGYLHLRLAPARNGQRLLVKSAADYGFGAIAQLGERVTGSHEVAGSSPASSTSNVRPLF